MSRKKKARRQTTGKQPQRPNKARERAARADKHADQSDGNKPARPAADSTDGNGNASDEATSPNDGGKPARRNQHKQTRRRAPTGERDNRKAAEPPADDGQPGTSDARPEHTERNGQEAPAQETKAPPGRRSQTAKQQRQDKGNEDTTNTPNRKAETTEPRQTRRTGHPQPRRVS